MERLGRWCHRNKALAALAGTSLVAPTTSSVCRKGRSQPRLGLTSVVTNEILEGLVKAFPGIADYSYDLSEAYARIHIPEPPIRRDVENSVMERFSKALAVLENLVIRHPDVPDFLAAQARLHHKLGAFHPGRCLDEAGATRRSRE